MPGDETVAVMGLLLLVQHVYADGGYIFGLAR